MTVVVVVVVACCVNVVEVVVVIVVVVAVVVIEVVVVVALKRRPATLFSRIVLAPLSFLLAGCVMSQFYLRFYSAAVNASLL